MKNSLKILTIYSIFCSFLTLAFAPIFGYGLLAEQPTYTPRHTFMTSQAYQTAGGDPPSAEDAKQKKVAEDEIKWCSDPEEDTCPSHE